MKLMVFCLISLSAAIAGAKNSGSINQLMKPAPAGSPSASSDADGTSAATLLDADGGAKSDKIDNLPSRNEDLKTERILNSLASQAGWFPDVKITVLQGMVTIQGKVKDKTQLDWLAKTADRMPSVIAVINKATIEELPITDLSPAINESKRLLERAKKGLPPFLLTLVLLAVFISIGRLISSLVHKLWSRKISNPFVLSTASRLTMIPLWLLFFYFTLQIAGLEGLASTILGGTGLVGIAFGFAFKDIAENYLSGLLLAMRSPFTKGDTIVVGTYEGVVQSLNMRGTTIMDVSGNMILIPNSIVIQSVVLNKTVNPNNRDTFVIGIGTNDSVKKAIELISTVLNKNLSVLKDPQPLVVVDDLGTSTIKIKSYYWTDGRKSDNRVIKSQLITEAKETLLAKGLSLPDESREVIFTEALKVQMLQAGEQEDSIVDRKRREQQEQASKNLDETLRTPPPAAVPPPDKHLQKLADETEMMSDNSSSGLIKS